MVPVRICISPKEFSVCFSCTPEHFNCTPEHFKVSRRCPKQRLCINEFQLYGFCYLIQFWMIYTFLISKGADLTWLDTLNKICCARSQKKHTFLMLSVLCAELLNNPFKSWSFWEETKIHFYCIFFLQIIHALHFVLSNWMNKSH